MRSSEVPVPTVTDSLDRTPRPASALEQTVLDGIPGERFTCQRLGGSMDLTCAQRLFGCRENLEHCSSNDP